MGGADKYRVVALKGAFHGRLHGSLAVTDRPDYRAPFEPLMPGVDFADPDSPADLDRLLDPAPDGCAHRGTHPGRGRDPGAAV